MIKDNVLIQWLQDAYTMETVILKKLKKRKKEFEGFEAIQRQLEEHIVDSNEHTHSVKTSLKELGSDVSDTNNRTLLIAGNIQRCSTENTRKEKLIKTVMAAYITEQTEIAMYRKILRVAEASENKKIVEMCQHILIQEEEMSELVIENLDELVSSYISNTTGTKS